MKSQPKSRVTKSLVNQVMGVFSRLGLRIWGYLPSLIPGPTPASVACSTVSDSSWGEALEQG